MSTFDPSKLNLDINNTEESSSENKSSITPPENPVSEEKTQKSNIDILADMSTIQETVKDTWNTKQDDINKEEIKEDIVESKTETKPQQEVPSSKIIDINIESLDNIVNLIQEKEYDYVIIEPEIQDVKITFKQDNIDREVKYIRYPNYTNILFKLKQTTSLILEDTGSSQEGKGTLKLGSKSFILQSKTAPGENGERLWIRAKEDNSIKVKKEKQKTPLSLILAFLGAILFVSLILGGAFIGFIVLNAKTIDDVKFFASLGINLNDINSFISQIVTLIFSILLFISTAALSWALFKFILTKKVYKRKRISYALLSSFLLILTFSIGSAWMYIDQQIKNLPNWQEQAYGDLKIFDNDLKVSSVFDDNTALISDTNNLIWPITLKFDLSNFETSQARKWLQIDKYIWDFGSDVQESFDSAITKTFSEVGNYELSVIAEGKDLEGNPISQELSNIPAISVSHTIKINESETRNGGKKLSLDATGLQNLGKVKWYFLEPNTEENTSPRYPEWTEMYEGYNFFPSDIFFYDIYIGVSLISGSDKDETLDKVIVIRPNGESDITGNILANISPENELEYTFQVTEASTGFGSGFIESYQWEIEDKTYNIGPEDIASKNSSILQHTFQSFGEQEVFVTLTNTSGVSQRLSKTINVQKQVELRTYLVIQNTDGEEVEEVRYEKHTHEYFLDNWWVPSNLEIDARYIRPKNILYSLKDVAWDLWNDGNIDASGKSYSFEIPTEGNHILAARYTFEHRKIPGDTLTLTEYIYVEGIKKDAILDLKMEYENNYAPVNVRFDASKSFIKNDDIVKFIYDYGDGIVEERDAINPGHVYKKAGDYNVKLTVKGKSWKEYSIEKSLILLPPAQEVSIETSLKRAPIGQWIDFSSADSTWQIVEYFWDFSDGNISTQANPTHSYKKAGTYTVKLRANFVNNNTITNTLKIEVY